MDDEPNLYNQKSFCLTKSSLKTAEGQHKDTTNGCRWAIESRNNQAHSTYFIIWVFPKIGVPQNGWFIREILIKMDDLGVPLFSETSISSYFKLLKFQVFPDFSPNQPFPSDSPSWFPPRNMLNVGMAASQFLEKRACCGGLVFSKVNVKCRKIEGACFGTKKHHEMFFVDAFCMLFFKVWKLCSLFFWSVIGRCMYSEILSWVGETVF